MWITFGKMWNIGKNQNFSVDMWTTQKPESERKKTAKQNKSESFQGF